jgi:hypothetical protein
MKKINHPRRLALLALSCLPCGRDCRPVLVGLAARTHFRILAAGLKRTREHAGEGARLACEASAALALALRVFIASVWEALRAGRTAAAVSRPEPVRTFERFALPVIDVPAPVEHPETPAPSGKLQQGKGSPHLFVATPRKDGRRPGKARMTYKPFTGQALKAGEYLATREGRRYRRVETGQQAAA